MADWIGSCRDWFPYRKPEPTVAEYWPEALSKAKAAGVGAGILSAPLPDALTPARLLPQKIAQSLSPLQQHVLDLELPDGPMLAIIEDVTGSGKTEAALLIAARLLMHDRANGLFFALPTMATANAMFERLAKSYRRLFADGTRPSLVLAHGKRKLHDGFTASILEDPMVGAWMARAMRRVAAHRARPGLPTTGARRSWRMWAWAPSTRHCSACAVAPSVPAALGLERSRADHRRSPRL